jgi:hypothetical protein
MTAAPAMIHRHLRLVASQPRPRQIEIRDLADLRFGGDFTVPVADAKTRYYAVACGTLYPKDETFYGHGFTGSEHLTDLVRVVELDDSAAPPTLLVERPWTLDDLYEVSRLACAFGLHEMTGHLPALDPIIAGLSAYGLAFAVPRCPPEMRAAHLAAGGNPDPNGLDSYEHLCSYVHWERTTFTFVPSTGTLTIRAQRGP